MKDGTIPYGSGISAPVARGRRPAWRPGPAPGTAEVLVSALRQPIGSPQLRDIAAGTRSAAILIPGKARVAGTREYVAALISELNHSGIPDRGIEVFLADGTHEQHVASDIMALLGEELADQGPLSRTTIPARTNWSSWAQRASGPRCSSTDECSMPR